MSVRVLIVDDEPIARRRMRRLLRLESDVEVLDDVGSGREAIDAIIEQRPDMVFLDVQMPDVDGFGVVDGVGTDRMPPTIFVTAYNEYAVRAFDVHAIDYLLKPFDAERFKAAFQRARAYIEQVSSAEQGRKIKALLGQVLGDEAATAMDRSGGGGGGVGGGGGGGTAVQTMPVRHRYVDRLTVKHDGRVFFVKAAEVDWFEAAGNYVRIHTGKSSHLIRETMQRVESQLDPNLFVRIHRAVIVNLDRIRELQPWFAGDYVVILRDGRQLKLSRTYREHLHTRMQSLS